jgi:hypothetical protein
MLHPFLHKTIPSPPLLTSTKPPHQNIIKHHQHVIPYTHMSSPTPTSSSTPVLPPWLTPALFLSRIQSIEALTPTQPIASILLHLAINSYITLLRDCAINLPVWLGPAPASSLLDLILAYCDAETGVWTSPQPPRYGFILNSNQARPLPREQAVRFANGLEEVSVHAEDLPPHCVVCWCEWGEDTENDNTPVRLPCPGGHVLGRDCLVEHLQMSRLCPLCRANVVE